MHKDLLGEEPRAGRLRERDRALLRVRARRVGRAAEVVRADARDERGRELRGVVGEGGGGGELRARERGVSLRAREGRARSDDDRATRWRTEKRKERGRTPSICANMVPSSSVTPSTTSLTHSSLSPRSSLFIVSCVHTAPAAPAGSSASERPESECVAVCCARRADEGAARRAARREVGVELEGSTPREVRIVS